MTYVPIDYWEHVEAYRLTGKTTEGRPFFTSAQIGDTLRGIRINWQSSTTPVGSSLSQLDSNVSRMREWLPESYIATLWARGMARAGVAFPQFHDWRHNITCYLRPDAWMEWPADTPAPDPALDPGPVPTNLYPPYTMPQPGGIIWENNTGVNTVETPHFGTPVPTPAPLPILAPGDIEWLRGKLEASVRRDNAIAGMSANAVGRPITIGSREGKAALARFLALGEREEQR